MTAFRCFSARSEDFAGFSRANKRLLLAGALLIAPVAAQAQEAVAADDAGDIVVTALKRNTRVQDTPLAITAVTGATLQQAGTTSFTELTRETPSLRIVDSGPGNRRVILRGVTAAGEPTVGVYYDEAPVSGSVGTTSDAAGATPDFRLFDVERAEVLRGPQGTLYGSGSMGGTLRIIFEKPRSDKVEAAVSGNMTSVKSGGYGGSLDAMINLPIVEDKIAVRVVGNYNRFAGYTDNIRYGLKDINDGKAYGGRAMVRLTPTDQLTVDLTANYEKVATDSPRFIAETGVKYATDAAAESGNYDTNRIYNGTLNYDFGAVSLTASTTYTDRDRTVVGDVSDTFTGRDTAARCQTNRGAGAPCSATVLASYLTDTRKLFASSLYQPQSVKNWLNEIRLSSSGSGPFNWTAGLFSEDRKTVVRSTLLIANPRNGQLLDFTRANIFYDRTINDKLKQKAAFAELSYKLWGKLTLTAGARYYDYRKTVGGRIDVGQEQYSSVVTPYTQAKSKEDGVISKFNVSYQINPDVMIYAQAAQGFRPGGVNQVIGLSAALAAYTSDSLWNYEAGFKSKIARSTYFNMSVYQIDWDNLQVSARTAGTGSVFGLIANAGAARIRGVEGEFNTAIIRGLSLSANGSFTDAKLTQDQISTVVVATGRKGDRLANVPRWNFGGSAEYTYALSSTLETMIRADATYNGSSYSAISPTDIYRRKMPEYTLVNTRLGIQAPDGGWGAYLFVNNVFDKYAIVSASSSSNTGGKTVLYAASPRTIGVNLMKKF